jgi:hypothetical protein
VLYILEICFMVVTMPPANAGDRQGMMWCAACNPACVQMMREITNAYVDQMLQ